MSYLVFLACISCAALSFQSSGLEDGDEPPAIVAALINALEAHDAAIDSIQWEQQFYFSPNSAMKRPQWLLLDSSTRYYDSQWRSLLSISSVSTNPPDFIPVPYKTTYITTTNAELAIAEHAPVGVLRNRDGFFAGNASLPRLTGSFLEYGSFIHSRSLIEMIRRAQSVQFLPPDSKEPWPGLSARGVLGDGGVDLEVRLDPEWQFAPRIIRSKRHADGLIAETLTTTQWQLIGGIALPRCGVLTQNYIKRVPDVAYPFPKMLAGDLDAAASMTGLPMGPEDAATSSALREAITCKTLDSASRLMTGPLGCFDENHGCIGIIVLVVSEAKLNPPFEPQSLTSSVSDDFPIFVGHLGERRDLAGVKQIMRDLESREREKK